MTSKGRLWRDAVVGWVITRSKEAFCDADMTGILDDDGDRRYYALSVIPIALDTEAFTTQNCRLFEDEKVQVIGVIPAAPGTCEVSGKVVRDGVSYIETLGYEIPGGDKLNWEELIREREERNAG
jgi:hypothetical protein